MGATTWKEDTTLRSPELVARIDVGLSALQKVRAVADRPVVETKQSVVGRIQEVRDAGEAHRILRRRNVLEGLEDRALGIRYGSAWKKPVSEIGAVLRTNLKVLAKQLNILNKELRAAAKGIRERMVLWLSQYKEKRELLGRSAGA